jgi:hypothetical protein
MADSPDPIGSKTIDRFSGRPEDFSLWNIRLTSVLDELDLLDIATGDETRPAEPSTETAESTAAIKKSTSGIAGCPCTWRA